MKKNNKKNGLSILSAIVAFSGVLFLCNKNRKSTNKSDKKLSFFRKVMIFLGIDIKPNSDKNGPNKVSPTSRSNSADTPAKDSDVPTGKRKKTETNEEAKIRENIIENFSAILNQNQDVLNKAGLPTADELYTLKIEQASWDVKHRALMKLKTKLFAEESVSYYLDKIRQYSYHIPQNAAIIDSNDPVMFLQISVWNTYLSLLFGFAEEINKELEQIENQNVIQKEEYINNLLAAFKECPGDLKTKEELIKEYADRKISLQESINSYQNSNINKELDSIKEIVTMLNILLESDNCKVLESGEPNGDLTEKVMCESLGIEMTKCVYEYYLKILNFINGDNGVNNFLNECKNRGYIK